MAAPEPSRLIVVGASAGGVEALSEFVAHLPAQLDAGVLIVLHISAHSRSVLASILDRAGPLAVSVAGHGDRISPGRVLVAPPDRHLLVADGHVRLDDGPRVNNHRPAIDALFRSAAETYGARVAGVVLSGSLDDGTAGLRAIKRRGGQALVQDPERSSYRGMPSSAIANVEVDLVASPGELATFLGHEPAVGQLATHAPQHGGAAAERERALHPAGDASGFTCPDCGGALWELHDGEAIEYRCRIGHAYSPESLVYRQRDALEEALWTAVRSLEERAALLRRMRDRARSGKRRQSSQRFDQEAQALTERAAIVRAALMNLGGANVDVAETAIAGPGERREGAR
jgi:two-component system chemotaxis response regulator CheB